MWVLKNGHVLGELDGLDRATQFGDGVFETMALLNGQIRHLERHIMRLQTSMMRLDIPIQPHFESEFRQFIEDIVAAASASDGVIKAMISRGTSARGYGYSEELDVNVWLTLSEYHAWPEALYEHGVTVGLSSVRCSINSNLAGLKTLNRLENVLARQEVDAPYFEKLMLNDFGHVVEGTMTNLFFEEEGALVTPRLTFSGIDGIARNWVIDHAEKNAWPVTEIDIEASSLERYSAGFVCNSLMGIVPIRHLEDKEYTIGARTRALMHAWNME